MLVRRVAKARKPLGFNSGSASMSSSMLMLVHSEALWLYTSKCSLGSVPTKVTPQKIRPSFLKSWSLGGELGRDFHEKNWKRSPLSFFNYTTQSPRCQYQTSSLRRLSSKFNFHQTTELLPSQHGNYARFPLKLPAWRLRTAPRMNQNIPSTETAI